MQNLDTVLLSEIYSSQILNEIKWMGGKLGGKNRGKFQHVPKERKAYENPFEPEGIPAKRLSHGITPEEEPQEDPLLQKIDLKRTFKLNIINDLKFIAQGREIVSKLLTNETLTNKLLDEILTNANPEDTQVWANFEAGDLIFKFRDDDYQEHQFQVELSTDSEGNVVDYNIF